MQCRLSAQWCTFCAILIVGTCSARDNSRPLGTSGHYSWLHPPHHLHLGRHCTLTIGHNSQSLHCAQESVYTQLHLLKLDQMWSDQHSWLHRMGFNCPKRAIKSNYLDAVSVADNVLRIQTFDTEGDLKSTVVLCFEKCIPWSTILSITWPLVMSRSEKQLVDHSLCGGLGAELVGH